MTQLNRRLVGFTPDGCFATVVLARIDPAFRSLHCVNAGHSPVFVLAPSGEVKACVESQTPPLGVERDAPSPVGQVVGLDPGDTVLLASDGLLGVRDPYGTAFGVEGLIGAVRAHLHAPPGVLIEVIHQAALHHAGAEEFPPYDDSTVVILRAV
ncbi:MAG: PP2C family protein-serine/threonine phosphatase [Isosphaeraceae bacterium]